MSYHAEEVEHMISALRAALYQLKARGEAAALLAIALALCGCTRRPEPPPVSPRLQAAGGSQRPVTEPSQQGEQGTFPNEAMSVEALHDTGALREEEYGEIRMCPQYFGLALRNTWHRVTGEDYYIDSEGRPSQVRAIVPPYVEDGRIEACQKQVGRWGKVLDASQAYHGGHMLGCQLGGWGARANMVPQVAGFKTGNWLQLENALHDCGNDLEPGRLEIVVRVGYADAATLVPDAMEMKITDMANGDAVTLTFVNAVKGGGHGAEERARGVAWLRSLGCANDEKVDEAPSPCSGG